MKAGREYEEFAFRHLKALFPDAIVTLDDKIMGHETGFERQIDVSLRLQVVQDEFLIIVQCKDYANKADIKVLGEFASVMQDVGALAGFMFCTAGFAKSNHQYANRKGISLFTIEDIESDRWPSSATIPVVLTENSVNFNLPVHVECTAELAELNRVPMPPPTISLETRVRNPLPVRTIKTMFDRHVLENGREAVRNTQVDFSTEARELELYPDVWVPVTKLVAFFTVHSKYYLKNIPPEEYAELRDHVSGQVLPVKWKLESPLDRDETWQQISAEDGQAFPGLNIQIERWL